MDARELSGLTFACLEGCGFCCTFQPEISGRELALLRQRLKPAPVRVIHGEDRTYLQLQNKCGACTLLARRACTQYDLRPAHCRHFPFHLHFAEEPEVYVNYTCRGVQRAEGGDLSVPFRAQVLDVAKSTEVQAHEQAAREAYGTFHRLARRAGVWGDARRVVEEALSRGPDLLTGPGLVEACRLGGEETTPHQLHEDALSAFHEEDVTQRPFYLPADLRWLTFGRAASGALAVLEMDEAGALAPVRELEGLSSWEDAPESLREGLASYLSRLLRRRVFVGSVYALVDESGFETPVEDAAWLRVAEVGADLVLRARVLRALGVPDAEVPDETARFYDSSFLDAPTIGGFL